MMFRPPFGVPVLFLGLVGLFVLRSLLVTQSTEGGLRGGDAGTAFDGQTLKGTVKLRPTVGKITNLRSTCGCVVVNQSENATANSSSQEIHYRWRVRGSAGQTVSQNVHFQRQDGKGTFDDGFRLLATIKPPESPAFIPGSICLGHFSPNERVLRTVRLKVPPNFLDTDKLRFNVAVFGNETATLPIQRMSGASRIATVSILFTAPSSKFDIPKVLKCELVDEAGNALCSLMVDIPQIKDLAIHPAKVLVTQPLDQNPLRFRLYGKEVAPMEVSVAGLSKNDWSVETDDCPRSKILWLKSLPHDIETEVIHIKTNLGEERIPFVVLRR